MSVTSYLIIFFHFIGYLFFADHLKSIKNETSQEPIFDSIEEAREYIRTLKKSDGLNGDIELYIKGGTYVLDSTFHLEKGDSGTESFTITYKPYQGELVRFLGGRKVTNFEKLSNTYAKDLIDERFHDKVLQADLKALGIKNYGKLKPTGFGRKIQPTGMELFFEGEPMTLARYPNEGWLRIKEVSQRGDKPIEKGLARSLRGGVPAGRHYGRFTYNEDLPDKWHDNQDIWLHGYWTHDWADSYVKVDSIDMLSREFILAPPHGVYGYSKNQKYYAFNILSELDTPGEWYLDRTQGILYFWPPTNIEGGSVYVSTLEDEMISMNNVSYVNFESFTFEVSRGKGMVIEGGSYVKIAGCTFRNMGTQGIVVNGGNHHGIESCDIYNIGDDGLILSGGNRKKLVPAEHYAVNNHIYNYSRVNRSYHPAIKLNGVGNRVAHNQIHDAPHAGVIFGGNNHMLEYNEIHHIAKETGDVGAFYIGRDWTKRGNIIRYNYFHDLYGPGVHGASAVYLDDMACGTHIYGNIFHKNNRGVLIGGGHDNIIDNNVFIDCNYAIHMDARGRTWAKDYIKKNGGWSMYKKLDAVDYKNPPYSTQYPELASIEKSDPAIPSGNLVKHNICYGPWLEIIDGAKAEYLPTQRNHIHKNIPKSINVDQGHIYPKKSVLRKISFNTLPFDKMGLYKDKYRVN